MYTASRTETEANMLLQKDINMLILWLKGSKLTINESKSKVMTIKPTIRARKKDNDLNIVMNGVTLEQVSVYKYLGLYLDDTLNFKKHLREIIKNVSHKVYLLSKIRPKLTEKAATMVFKGMILPLFDIGDVSYGSASQVLLDKLRVLQNRALRIIFRIHARENTTLAEKKINLMPLEQRRLLHVMQIARWIKEKGVFVDKRRLPTRAHAPNRHMLTVQRPRVTLYQRSFIQKACIAWNKLPTDLHTEKDPEVYKKRVKELICSNKLMT